jgi:hypothetical protein
MIARALIFLVTTLLVSIVSREVQAQSVTVGTIITRRANRPTLDTKTINYDDCVNNDTISLTVTPVMASNYSMEIWVGAGSNQCQTDAVRQSPATSTEQCWQLRTINPAVISDLTFQVRDVLKFHGSEEAGNDVCDEVAAGGTGGGSLTIYFILINGNTSTGTAGQLPLKFDLIGPAAPTNLGIGIGDTRLYPTWTITSGTTADTKGYYVYCEESAGACTGTQLVEDGIPVAALQRGSAGVNSTTGEASGLTNFTEYVCGVAGYDALNNQGKLSELVCGTPQPVNGYFKSYRASGGEAGGGYCTFGRAPVGGGGAVVLLALGALAIRRRSKRSN